MLTRYARRILPAGLTLVLLLCFAVSLVWGYGEEPLHFIDPLTGEEYDTEVSSIHFDLSYALAVCAGFHEADARTIQLYSQLVDSQEVGPYSLGTGSLPEVPPAAEVCTPPDDLNVIFPVTRAIECPGCFSSRFGPFSAYFHFPRNTPDELGQTRAWAYGEVDSLVAPAEFAYGGTEVVSATCIYTPTMTIDTGTVQSGSLEAFGIYLHSLGDYWSHRDCVAALDAGGEPWGTHTNAYPQCGFTDHTLEFGQPNTDTNRTLEGVHAIYEELKTRSRTHEGIYPPLTEGALNGWLTQQLYTFVHEWTWLNAQARRDLAAHIANQCQAIHTSCADFDNNGRTESSDIGLVASEWGRPISPTNELDRDGSGFIDIVDILQVSSVWGRRCQPTVLTRVPLEALPHGVTVSPDGSTIYTANFSNDTFTVLDAESLTITAVISAGLGAGPVNLQAVTNGNWIYATNEFSDMLSVIDTQTNQVVDTHPTLNRPHGLALGPDPATGMPNQRLYVANQQSDRVSVFTIAGSLVTHLDDILVGNTPYNLVVSPDGQWVWVTNYGSPLVPSSVSLIDAQTLMQVTTIPLGLHPHGIAISPDGSRLYVSLEGDDQVVVIDTAAREVLGDPIAVGNGPHGLALSPDGNFLWTGNVGNNLGHSSTILHAPTGVTVTQVALGPMSEPHTLAFSPDGHRVYISDLGTGNLIVVDTGQ